MNLPVTGPIKFSDLLTEFQSEGSVSLSQYYRGGDLVANHNYGVPAYGTISMSNFFGAGRSFPFNVVLQFDTVNFNLYNRARAGGWDGIVPLAASVMVGPGVVLGSDSTTKFAFDAYGAFPNGSQLVLDNRGLIVGAGGNGGIGHEEPGKAGGPAIRLGIDTVMANYNTIAGGGGGGGGGFNNWQSFAGGGGGGAGRNAGYGGAGTNGTGENGTLRLGGKGGYRAGRGGDLGHEGGPGSSYYGTYVAGGAAGAAIVGDSNVSTWVSNGIIIGTRS